MGFGPSPRPPFQAPMTYARGPMATSPRPRLGISACLLGQPVRYDSGHKRDPFCVDLLGPLVDWVPVCPEVEVGMPVPRPSIRLTGRSESPALVAERTGEDWTERMAAFAARRVEQLGRLGLDGYVTKKDSPSCGLARVRVHGSKGGPPRRDGVGAFVRVLTGAAAAPAHRGGGAAPRSAPARELRGADLRPRPLEGAPVGRAHPGRAGGLPHRAEAGGAGPQPRGLPQAGEAGGRREGEADPGGGRGLRRAPARLAGGPGHARAPRQRAAARRRLLQGGAARRAAASWRRPSPTSAAATSRWWCRSRCCARRRAGTAPSTCSGRPTSTRTRAS